MFFLTQQLVSSAYPWEEDNPKDQRMHSEMLVTSFHLGHFLQPASPPCCPDVYERKGRNLSCLLAFTNERASQEAPKRKVDCLFYQAPQSQDQQIRHRPFDSITGGGFGFSTPGYFHSTISFARTCGRTSQYWRLVEIKFVTKEREVDMLACLATCFEKGKSSFLG